MATKFIIRSFQPGGKNHNKINPLINLSDLGISAGNNILSRAQAYSASETQYQLGNGYYDSFYDALSDQQNPANHSKLRDLTKFSTGNYAFYDQAYTTRRMHCQELATDAEISFVLDTISNESIIPDENGYIAQLNIDRLKMFLNKDFKTSNDTADKLIRDCKIAYNIVYSNFGWDANNGAWHAYRQFLIDGFLAFEIILNEERNMISGIMQLDPVTLEPSIDIGPNGESLLIWYQYKGQSNERKIPDSNIIYISWGGHNMNRIHTISYVEGLMRPYNMLKQLEQSHLIWNIQNAQKRMKLTVPVGDLSEQKARNRISQLMADYQEEVSFDEMSGQMLVNGEPKFNFQKTYVFEDHGGQVINLEEIETAGYDLSATENLQYFWRKFILDSQLPLNRFAFNITQQNSTPMTGDAAVTREEYAFSRFIQRIQSIFKDLLLKPLWLQICLMHPELSTIDYLKQGLGIVYNEENLFTQEKKKNVISSGAQTIQTLSGIQKPDGTPYFSIEYLVKEYLGLSDADLELNKKYKEQEIVNQLKTLKAQKRQQEENMNTEGLEPEMANEGGGFNMDNFDMGGDNGGGFDMGGDSGGGFDMGSSEPEPVPEPEPEPAPEPEV